MAVLTIASSTASGSAIPVDHSPALPGWAVRIERMSRRAPAATRIFVWVACWPLIVATRLVTDRSAQDP